MSTSKTQLMEGLKKLNPMERKYFRVILSQSGVLYIEGKPGMAKSAMLRSIANKLGMNFIDIRLSMVDETDVGIYPTIGEVEDVNGNMVQCLNYVPPKWAVEANSEPTLIIFEELNRASLPVRNASLQILNEREVAGYKLNDNVFMVASGNLGEEDGTDVEEMDNALLNRLISIKHELSFDEWKEFFAEDNVHPLIVNFIEANQSYFYKAPTEGEKAYPTPRSWTNLSKLIETNWGFEAESSTWVNEIKDVIHGYIGVASNKFLNFVNEAKKITAKQILKGIDKYKNAIPRLTRSQKSEILFELKHMKFSKLRAKEVDNLVAYLKFVDTDERASYLDHVLNQVQKEDGIDIFTTDTPQLDKLFKTFKEENKAMQKAMDIDV